MAVADASKWFTRQGGEPATAFISGSDGVAAVTQTYTDFEAADALKAPLASPTLTGVPAAPTAAVGTNTTQVATTAFTVAQIADDAVAKAAVGNLLTANQASIETDTTGWGNVSNASIAASATQAKNGTKSLRLTATATDAYMDVQTTGGYIPVTAGQTYTVSGQSRAGSAAREISPFIFWYDAGNVELSATAANQVNNSTSGWTRHLSTAVAPATATQAVVMFRVFDVAASEIHYLDELGFWEGAGGQWALPGTPITNLGFYTDESVGRRLFQWDANNSRFQQTYGDTGWRNVTSLVNVSGWTNAPTALAVSVRRTLEQSSMIVQWNPGTGSCSGQGVLTLPPGFEPAAGIIAPGGAWHSSDAGAYVGGWYWASSTEIDLQSPATSVILRAMATLPCTAPWPTTLPGTASGSIPA